MKIKIPNRIFGAPIPEDAIEKALAKQKKQPTHPKQRNQPLPNLDNYIYIPSINLYIAKERTHLGKNWHETKDALKSQNLSMPTIPQFIEFINYLKQNPNTSDSNKILDDILTIRSPWRAEWLDAQFSQVNRKWKISYQGKTEPLEKRLMKDCYADILGSANKQGLPTRESSNEDIYYFHPRNDAVARFDADSDWADLDCFVDPSDSDSSHGVFPCAEGTRAL